MASHREEGSIHKSTTLMFITLPRLVGIKGQLLREGYIPKAPAPPTSTTRTAYLPYRNLQPPKVPGTRPQDSTTKGPSGGASHRL